MKMHNLTASSFADRIGVQRSSISHIMSGRNKPSLDFIEKTLISFPRVDAGWLVLGKQSIPTTKSEKAKQSTDIATVKPIERVESVSGNDSQVDSSIRSTGTQRTISRIVVFYSDGTFEER